MMYVESGSGKVPLLSLIAILAISLTVNLPGLAISPIMAKLNEVFPHATKLEVQLLNVLPNFVTIPFILCSGKICTPANQLKVLTCGLIVYAATGVGYFFADSMVMLIVLSCLLGVGCGLVIPLAASLISQNFSGEALGTALGFKSGLSNFTVILATLFVGWVASVNWHAAFTVYFVPLIPLCLVPFMRAKYINKIRNTNVRAAVDASTIDDSFHFQGKSARRMMAAAMGLYMITTYATMAISYYLPYTMDHYGLNTSKVGVATAMFYLSATLAGFGLSKVIKITRTWTLQAGMVLATGGLLAVGLIHSYWCYIVGVFLMGVGYGLVQPILYDKTSYFAPNAAKSTEYFAFLLTCNYIGISIVPFVVEAFQAIFHQQHNASFAFILNGIILSVVTIVCFWKNRSFVLQAGVIPGQTPTTSPANEKKLLTAYDSIDEVIDGLEKQIESLKKMKETLKAADIKATVATQDESSQPAPDNGNSNG
ncbi:MAG: MFS transporter [Paramuribaculum sp.]|nr:MFS transporter [Paramuribaculum sp.]